MNTRTSLVLASLALAASAPLASAQFSIPWYTIDCGGGTASGGSFTLSGTIGQHDAAAQIAGGTFTVRGGFWTGSPCPADFNGTNGVGVTDIFDFLAAWFAGSPTADFNGTGGITIQDIFDFLAAWFAGC